jgi:hypothetical protein
VAGPSRKSDGRNAPRKALGVRWLRDAKRKMTPEQRAAGKAKLEAIKKKHAPTAFRLTQTALTALLEMEALEERMELEAEADVNENYAELFDDTKLTFATEYRQLVEERDDGDSVTTFEDARFLVQTAHDEALSLVSPSEIEKSIWADKVAPTKALGDAVEVAFAAFLKAAAGPNHDNKNNNKEEEASARARLEAVKPEIAKALVAAAIDYAHTGAFFSSSAAVNGDGSE